MHLVHCPFGGQQIATHDAIQNIMYALVERVGKLKEWAHCMEIVVVCLYVKSFIMSHSLHDPRGPSLRYQCGGY